MRRHAAVRLPSRSRPVNVSSRNPLSPSADFHTATTSASSSSNCTVSGTTTTTSTYQLFCPGETGSTDSAFGPSTLSGRERLGMECFLDWMFCLPSNHKCQRVKKQSTNQWPGLILLSFTQGRLIVPPSPEGTKH